MADHEDTLVEVREAVMHPPSGGNPTRRKAHFLKPLLKEHDKDLPSPPGSLFSPESITNKTRYQMKSYKRNPTENWKIWVERLKPRWQEIWKQAGIYEAILASTYTFSKDKDLIIGLAERWCAETNTLVFPWGEVSITLEDVIFLGNYSVLGASFFSPVADENVSILSGLKRVHRECSRNRGQVVTASKWMQYFMCGGDQLEHEAFLAMWLSKFVVICSADHISVRNFQAAINLSRGNRIALAPLVLASIYRDMRLLHNSIVESVAEMTFSVCHADLVHMWAWERFPNLRPPPSVLERGEPRSARWNGVEIMKVKDMRAALDSAKELFMWRPYSITSSDCMLSNLYRDDEQWVVVDSDETESYARCLRVSWLVGSGHIEQYLPHRVAMQFGYDQDVPPRVVLPNQSPETAWRSYRRRIRGTKLYIPPRLFESDVSSRYMVWWKSFMSVNEETPGCDEEISEDEIPIAQLMSQSRKTKNSGKRFNLEPKEDAVMSKCDDHTEVDPDNSKDCNSSEAARVEVKTLDAPDCPSEVAERQEEFVDEDSMTITQLLSRSETNGCLGMTPSGKQNKCNSCTGNPTDLEADSVIAVANDEVVRKASCPEHNIVNIKEESSGSSPSESPQLDLEARIWRLEKIFEIIKAEKLAASSGRILG